MLCKGRVLPSRAQGTHLSAGAASGDVKEFGFREITNQRKAPDTEELALQPVPVPPPEHMADPRLAVTVCVSGMVSSAEVPSPAQKLPDAGKQ